VKNEMSLACSTYGEGRGVYRIVVGKPEERDHLEDSVIGGRILLIWISRKIGG
jgi:hypothetical protein